MSEILTESSTSVSPKELLECMVCPHNVVDQVISFTLGQYESGVIRSNELLDISTSSLRRCGAHAIRGGDVISCPIIDKYGPETK